MSDVKRFNFIQNYCDSTMRYHDAEMLEAETGKYVLYSDCETLQRQAEQLSAQQSVEPVASQWNHVDELIDRLHTGIHSILEFCTKEYVDGYRMAIFHAEQIVDWLKGDSADDWRTGLVAEKNNLLDLAGRFVCHTEAFCEDSELSPEFLELLNDMRTAIGRPQSLPEAK